MQETANRDPNYVTTLLGVDMTTGKLPTKVYVDEVTHRMLVSGIITNNSPTIFRDYDDFKQINPDANGNYQTITLKSSGVTDYTLTLVYDPGGTVTSIVRT